MTTTFQPDRISYCMIPAEVLRSRTTIWQDLWHISKPSRRGFYSNIPVLFLFFFNIHDHRSNLLMYMLFFLQVHSQLLTVWRDIFLDAFKSCTINAAHYYKTSRKTGLVYQHLIWNGYFVWGSYISCCRLRQVKQYVHHKALEIVLKEYKQLSRRHVSRACITHNKFNLFFLRALQVIVHVRSMLGLLQWVPRGRSQHWRCASFLPFPSIFAWWFARCGVANGGKTIYQKPIPRCKWPGAQHWAW